MGGRGVGGEEYFGERCIESGVEGSTEEMVEV
jgi:hypothetical protein